MMRKIKKQGYEKNTNCYEKPTSLFFGSSVNESSFGASQSHQPLLPLCCIHRFHIKMLLPWYDQLQPRVVSWVNWGKHEEVKNYIRITGLISHSGRREILLLRYTIISPLISHTDILILPLLPLHTSSCES